MPVGHLRGTEQLGLLRGGQQFAAEQCGKETLHIARGRDHPVRLATLGAHVYQVASAVPQVSNQMRPWHLRITLRHECAVQTQRSQYPGLDFPSERMLCEALDHSAEHAVVECVVLLLGARREHLARPWLVRRAQGAVDDVVEIPVGEAVRVKVFEAGWLGIY